MVCRDGGPVVLFTRRIARVADRVGKLDFPVYFASHGVVILMS